MDIDNENDLPIVLIVDDQPICIEILQTQLLTLSAKIRVEVCTSLENFTDYVAALQPHLILLDVVMGGSEYGLDLCRMVTTDERTSDIPVILLTCNDSESDEIKGFESGAKDYICKPYNAQILINRVMTHVELCEKTRLLQTECEIDTLTSLTNRNGWNKKSAHRIKHAARMNVAVSVVFFDIDWFKPFNDTYGHDKGDEILKLVAQALKPAFHKNPLNVIARIGGEEFVAILVDSSNECIRSAMEQVNKDIDALNIQHPTSPYKTLTLSGGVCTLLNPALNDNVGELMKIADNNLYESKNTGRNKTTYTTIESL